ncbi:MAG: hypothetical protein DRP09_16215 [Candidatus Thorarchaeota archaeon]|nr:MAG: hypothetical protein DRP09_16215 [Candidatus Thorarchaeota archaeon]
MSEDMKVDIVEYKDALAKDLAAMYNTWDELWPGGFTQGVPYTEERVRKNYGKMDAIAILIAIDKESGKPVGSCTLHQHWRDEDAAYIGTLGVSPEALNKKVGKHLLLEAVRRVKKRGFQRVDLNTWAGNMRAVPLYKKIGLMWNPEGQGLTMEGYVPAILNNTICAPFFERHASGEEDWYSLHVREITQAPDDVMDQGMAVYRYRFESDDDELEVIVDRYAHGLSGVTRRLGDEVLRVRTRLSSQHVVCGIQETHIFEIENRGAESVKMQVRLTGPDDVEFREKVTIDVNLQSGKSFSWEVPFVFAPDAEIFRQGVRAPTIRTHVKLGDDEFELVTGAKVTPAADIYTKQGICRLAPGGSSTIPLTIASNLENRVKAHIRIEAPSGLAVSVDREIFEMPPEGFGGALVRVEADKSLSEGAHDLWVGLELTLKNGMKVVNRRTRVPVFCLGKRGVAVGEDDRKREIVVANPNYVARCSREGGALTVSNPLATNPMTFVLRSAIGPPFGLSPFRFAERTLRTESTENETSVVLYAHHPERPLVIEDITVFEHGSNVVRREVWVQNDGPDEHTCQVRIQGQGGGFSFNEARAFVPLQSGIVTEPVGNSHLSYPAVTSTPDTFKEGWIATEGRDQAQGCVWNNDEAEEIRILSGGLSNFTSKSNTLKPGERRMMASVTLMLNASGWRDIRRLWNARVRGTYEPAFGEQESPKPLLDITASPCIIHGKGTASVRVRVKNMVPTPFSGVVHINPPEGWSLVTELEDELTVEDAIDIDLEFTPSDTVPDGHGVYRGLVSIVSGADYEASFYVVCLGGGSSEVTVAEDEVQGKHVYRVANGEIEFVVSDDYGGCMTSLKNKKGIEYLLTSFPNPGARPGAFFDNYYGGVQPILFDEDLDVPLDKAKTNQEDMSIAECEEGVWKGVELTWTGRIQRPVRGLELSLKYMTSGGSPLVYVKWTMRNKTSAPMRFFPLFLIDPAYDGDPSVLHFEAEWSGAQRHVYPAPMMNAMIPSSNYVFLATHGSDDRSGGLAILTPHKDTLLVAAHAGVTIFSGVIDFRTWVPAGEEWTMECVLFLDPDSREAVEALQEVIRGF